MATKRKRKCGNWEYRFVRKKILPKVIYMTFKTEAQGDTFADYAERLLRNGIIPNEFKQMLRII